MTVTNPTQPQQPNPSTLRAILPWAQAVAGLAFLGLAIAFLVAVRRMDADIKGATADLARRDAANAPAARLDR